MTNNLRKHLQRIITVALLLVLVVPLAAHTAHAAPSGTINFAFWN